MTSWADRGEGDHPDDDPPSGRDPNRVVGARSRSVLEYVVRGIVDDPDAVDVEVDEDPDDDSVTFRLHVAPSDMGRVIGKRGRTAQAIRRVVRVAGVTEDVAATVDIVD